MILVVEIASVLLGILEIVREVLPLVPPGLNDNRVFVSLLIVYTIEDLLFYLIAHMGLVFFNQLGFKGIVTVSGNFKFKLIYRTFHMFGGFIVLSIADLFGKMRFSSASRAASVICLISGASTTSLPSMDAPAFICSRKHLLNQMSFSCVFLLKFNILSD